MRFCFGAVAVGFCLALLPPVGASAQVVAQSGGCILDNCRDRTPVAPAPRANEAPPPAGNRSPVVAAPSARSLPAVAPGDFDFYVLSLSWSSGFCAGASSAINSDQCNIGSHLTFVVHGLWPQFEQSFPSNCDTSAPQPSRADLALTHGVYPSEGLARYEWRKHGTCTGKTPGDYFSDVKFARDQVKIPPELLQLQSDEQIAPIDIQREFQAANPQLRPGMMAVGCQRNLLQEVRICLTKDLGAFRTCGEVARGSCRTRQITVPAPR